VKLERVDLEREALEGVVQEGVETEPVLVVVEYAPTIVAPQDHMIDGPGYVDAFLSRHGAIIP